MTAQRWTQQVRHQLGLGRLVALGGPGDGAWLAESAAETVLRRAAAGLPGVRLGRVRLALADPETAAEPAVPPPPSGLPPGALRVSADLAATAAEPLPVTASRVRVTLTRAAQHLGLAVTEVDVRVTELLEAEPGPGGVAAPDAVAEPSVVAEPGSVAAPGAGVAPGSAAAPGAETRPGPRVPSGAETRPGAHAAPGPDAEAVAEAVRPPEQGPDAGGADRADGYEARVRRAALAVPGVTGLTGFLGRAVHVGEGPHPAAALPRRHVRLELAVAGDHRAVEVARAVRAAVTEALEDRPTVAVLVTAVS
ncbi:hypothetical protein [Streptomyces griseosporeus]|uniref:hypothetical protein n=1 Tax=Streptomyces griseosporeus TaxID=1910 RepID=UPI003703620F